MALDIGSVRTGIAISDPKMAVASPVCVLSTSDVLSVAPAWKRVLSDWQPEMLLFGLPLSLSGGESQQTKSVRKTAGTIAKNAGLNVEFIDERLSSAQAKNLLREQGLNEREMRGKIDMVAASLFLQSWLDAKSVKER